MNPTVNVDVARPVEPHEADKALEWEPRVGEASWWQTRQSREGLVERLLRMFTDPGAGLTRDKTRRRGLSKLLDWLEGQPGETWQDRWMASGADDAGFEWTDLPLRGRGTPKSHWRDELATGLVLLVAGQAIRPSYPWLLRQRVAMMLTESRAASDPDAFQRLEQLAQHATPTARSDALNKLTWIVIRKGGLVSDITVGDCIELTAALEEHHFRGSAGRPLFYALLKETGVLPASAPQRLRALRVEGRRSVEQIVDAYGIECRAVRDLLVEYFTERAPELDHVSLRSIARNLCRLFWRDLEIHHPGIDSLRLTPQVAQAWKERLAYIRDAQGHPVRPRVNYRSELVFVRAFYQDIARWAADDPARWAPWVAPCAIKANECATKKSKARVKSRMDQRTRTQLPLLPALLRAVDRQRKDAEARITAARATPTGGRFLVAGEEFERCGTGQARRVYVTEVAASRRRNLTHEEEAAFWSWATVEVLRHTGIRIEEMLELTHHSFIAYTLPTTGEVVPMLQVAPSKTDAERLLLVSPELAEVLTAVIFRVRAGNAALPLVSAYDVFEQTWSPPMPFLFQRRYGTEDRPLTRSYIRECLVATSQSAQITVAGDPLEWRPHDFRRIEAGGHARAYSPAVHRPPRHARHPPGRRTKQRRFGGLSTDTFGVSSAQNGGPLMGACGMIANMSEPELGLLSRLWDEHKRATFPPHLRGQDIEGEDMVMLDADIAGCVSSSLAGPLDERRRSILLRCLAALQKVVPSISDEGSAVEYYERLREMATLATEAGNAKAQ